MAKLIQLHPQKFQFLPLSPATLRKCYSLLTLKGLFTITLCFPRRSSVRIDCGFRRNLIMIFVGCINFKWANFWEGWLATIRGDGGVDFWTYLCLVVNLRYYDHKIILEEFP